MAKLQFGKPVISSHVIPHIYTNQEDEMQAAAICDVFCNTIKIGMLERYDYEQKDGSVHMIYRFTSQDGNWVVTGDKEPVCKEVLTRLTRGCP